MGGNKAAATARSMSSWGHAEHGPAFIKVQWPASSQQRQVCRSGESIGGGPSYLLDMEDCLLAGCHRCSSESVSVTLSESFILPVWQNESSLRGHEASAHCQEGRDLSCSCCANHLSSGVTAWTEMSLGHTW
ncbi:hypothetical protein BDL97_10G009700 [Sphagnum fallax]|nr:hypothetical protein BDL97_10G009700 [Sphagnum fallax]KAH8949048.1 hypothetical protein BDL97_10G009700 [Sphagnum fallax]